MDFIFTFFLHEILIKLPTILTSFLFDSKKANFVFFTQDWKLFLFQKIELY